MSVLDRDEYGQAGNAAKYESSRHQLLEDLVLEVTRARLREWGGRTHDGGNTWVLSRSDWDEPIEGLAHGTYLTDPFPGPPAATGMVKGHSYGGLGPSVEFDVMDFGAQVYQPIRNNVEGLFQKWMDLPDPASTEALSDDLAECVIRLADPGAPGSGHHTDDLYNYYNQALAATNDMTGLAMDSFRDNYADRLRPVTANNRNLVGALVAVSEAQRLLWMSGRAGVVMMLEAYTEAFKQVPASPSISWTDVFKIIGLVTTTVGAVVALKALALIGAGAAIGGAISSREVEPAGDTVNSLWTNLIAQSDELSELLRAEEEFAEQVLQDVLDHARNERQDYYLRRPGLLDETDKDQFFDPASGFDVNADGLRVAANQRLRPAADILDGVQSQLMSSNSSGLWSRSEVGMAPSGPTIRFNSVRAAASVNIGRLATDIRDLADVLEVVADNYERSDEEFTQALEALAGPDPVSRPPAFPMEPV